MIDYYQKAPFVTIKQMDGCIKFEKNNEQPLYFNNKEKILTLEILCKYGKVEINDITREGKPVDINLLNDLVNKGLLESCMDLFP